MTRVESIFLPYYYINYKIYFRRKQMDEGRSYFQLIQYNFISISFFFSEASGKIQCLPLPGPFLPCQDLFDWWTLRCGVWIVFLCALLGNGTVVFVLIFSRSKMDVPKFLVCNLAAADFFMGIYLGKFLLAILPGHLYLMYFQRIFIVLYYFIFFKSLINVLKILL